MADYDSDEEEGAVKYQVTYADDNSVHNAIVRDGLATAVHANGDTYTGEYRDGKRNGKGAYKFANGNAYEGEYVDDAKHGYGVMSYTDGSKYDGEWQNNKRHGKGHYVYPNNDSYVGDWLNNMKHGEGRYVYADSGSVYVGEWSNNNLMHGKWNQHDKTSYIGRFSNNLPQGDGLFVFANGNVQNGKFTKEQQWMKDKFKSPAVDAVPPTPSVPSVKDKAVRLINKSLLVVDHYEGISEAKEDDVKGAPNFRQASDQVAVFATGQPTFSGITEVVNATSEAGFDSVVWICQRDTPVVFVNDLSLTPRAPKNFNTPLVFPELDMKQLPELDKVLQAKVRKELGITGGLLQYVKEAAADQDEDAKRVQLTLSVEQEIDEELDEDELAAMSDELKYPVQTVKEVFAKLGDEVDSDVRFVRLVLSESKVPSVEQLDKLMKIFNDAGESTAILFQSHTGLGQSTIGMVFAALHKKLSEEEEEVELEEEEEEVIEEIEDEEEDDEEDEEAREARLEKKRQERAAAKKAAEEANFVADYSKGEYAAVMALIAAIEGGEKIKAEVDQAIDRCGAVQNLRASILALKDQHAAATTAEEQARLFALAQDGFELYVNLIVFHTYLRKNEDEFSTKYSKWYASTGAALVAEHLGTREAGALAAFQWV